MIGDSQRSADALEKTFKVILITVIGLNLLVTFWGALSMPIDGDGRLYHAPRALYFIQNRSILPVESATVQMMALPYGTDLIFAGAVALTGSETAGKLAMWLAHPLLVLAVWGVLTLLGTAPLLRAALTALVATAGLIPGLLLSLKPELYQTVWVFGCLYCGLRARSAEESRRPVWLAVAAGLAVLSISAKPVSAPVMLLAGYWLIRERPQLRKTCLYMSGAVVIAAIGSGLVFTAYYTWKWFGRPFSIGPMEAEIYRDPSLGRFGVHLFRFVVTLLNPLTPEAGGHLGMPWLTELSHWIERLLASFASLIGMHRELPQETEGLWPGPFRYIAQGGAGNMGLFNIIGLGAVIWSLMSIRERPAPFHFQVSLVSAVSIALALYLIRWQPGLTRILFFAVALWMIPFGALAARCKAGIWVVVSLALIQGGGVLAGTVHYYRSYRIDGNPATAMFSLRPVASGLPGNARVLYMGSSVAYEYDLFGSDRKLFPWGRHVYSKSRLDGKLRETGADHVLLDNCARFSGMQHACPWKYDEFEAELESRDDWERVKVNVPPTPVADSPENYLVLFRRRSLTE